ncbi:hypothetical protein HYPSUDRAFT_210282 [Hypholoma sublateritium FD-334 SS-4]|uniref:Uncharacterized protein n=1 Tax=Hypholoma sublateritium (strain FD-334 SS-4) TaxID=945553 RepID=A0A0D2LPD4_HYPSF|nr:hypothetical protein HYPSUDRAFT_210282 [Hypholoma sublateritium FD-334 SS-4]
MGSSNPPSPLMPASHVAHWMTPPSSSPSSRTGQALSTTDLRPPSLLPPSPTLAPPRAVLALAARSLDVPTRFDPPLDEGEKVSTVPEAAAVHAAVAIVSVAACISADGVVDSDWPEFIRPPAQFPCHERLFIAVALTRHGPSPTRPMDSAADQTASPSSRHAHLSTTLNTTPHTLLRPALPRIPSPRAARVHATLICCLYHRLQRHRLSPSTIFMQAYPMQAYPRVVSASALTRTDP